MASSQSGILVNLYRSRIGEPSTGDEAYGYWLFVLGLIAGVAGIILFFLSESSADATRGAGIALGAFGLLMLVAGPIIRLQLRKAATYITGVGVLIGLAAIAWFFTVYPDDWVRGAGQAETVILVYGIGLAVVAIGGIVVPLITGPTESATEELESSLAAAESARKAAENERDEERSARKEAESALEEAETAREQAESARTAAEEERDDAVAARVEAQSAREAAEEASESERESRLAAESARDEAAAAASEEAVARAAIAAEIERIEESQSQFELYEDKGGKYRWRLRHRNGNVIATSGEGYASRQKAQQGISGVKRDAYGGSVIDIERTDAEVDDVDDALSGEDAVEYAPEVESQATFEQYEDNAGEFRWRLRHDNGKIICDSGEGYASKSGLKRAVERVKHYVQPADYLSVDPVAFELYKDNASEWRWRLIHENGKNIANGGEGYSSRTKARQGLESVRQNVAEDGNADFEVYEDNRGKYRWRLRHANGEIIADSGQGYASESGAEDAVERVRNYAPEAPHLDIGTAAFEIYEDNAEEWRWRLRSRNGNGLADSSQGYGSRRAAEAAVVRIKRHAPQAESVWDDEQGDESEE